MAQCLNLGNRFTSTEDGLSYVVFRDEVIDLDSCSNILSSEVLLTSAEYFELKTNAEVITKIDDAFGLLDPVEISAVFGICFAIIVTVSAAAYKVKVGKKMIKLA